MLDSLVFREFSAARKDKFISLFKALGLKPCGQVGRGKLSLGQGSPYSPTLRPLYCKSVEWLHSVDLLTSE